MSRASTRAAVATLAPRGPRPTRDAPKARDRAPDPEPFGTDTARAPRAGDSRYAPPVVLPLLACTAASPDGSNPSTVGAGPGGGPEVLPGDTTAAWELYNDSVVHRFELELSADALHRLELDPKAYVEGAMVHEGERWEPIGVRLKGSASFQPIGQKPALRLDFDQYVDGMSFHGHERIGLHNNVWDASAMAETLAYRTWREADNPAPRTGYAEVYLNGELRGLYTVVEPMDGEFVDQWWEGPHGALYEMTRSCDFDVGCDCYELQVEGAGYDPAGLGRGCEAARAGTVEAVAAAFDWERMVRYLALEKALNHPDSYSYNLNNYHIYHDPIADRLTLTPWGADSTFVYVYPPWELSQPCEPVYLDVDYTATVGWLARWCEDEPTCRGAMLDELESLATHLEDIDLVGLAEATHARIREHVAADPMVAYSLADHDYQAACFVDWIRRRPDELRVWVAAAR